MIGLVPGATLVANIDIAMPSHSGLDATHRLSQESDERLTIKLEYLESYEAMGIVNLTCSSGCVCSPQRIDAHKVGAFRNVSAFTQHSFTVMPYGERREILLRHHCQLNLQILEDTSSGGNKFKVRSLLVEDT